MIRRRKNLAKKTLREKLVKKGPIGMSETTKMTVKNLAKKMMCEKLVKKVLQYAWNDENDEKKRCAKFETNIFILCTFASSLRNCRDCYSNCYCNTRLHHCMHYTHTRVWTALCVARWRCALRSSVPQRQIKFLKKVSIFDNFSLLVRANEKWVTYSWSAHFSLSNYTRFAAKNARFEFSIFNF